MGDSGTTAPATPSRWLLQPSCERLRADPRRKPRSRRRSARCRSTRHRPAARFRSVKYAILMYAAPRHTRAMSESELDVIARKHAKLRDELTASSELAGGAGLVLPDETTVLRLGVDEPDVQDGPLS